MDMDLELEMAVAMDLAMDLDQELAIALALALDMDMDLEMAMAMDLERVLDLDVALDLDLDLDMDLEVEGGVDMGTDLEMGMDMDLEMEGGVDMGTDLEMGMDLDNSSNFGTMELMKRALILVQGISSKDYLYNSILRSRFKQGKYDQVKLVPTEDIFDKGDWFQRLPVVGLWKDTLGYITKYFCNKKKRKEVCKRVNETIKDLTARGYQVDVFAHSLGTIITLTCGRALSPLTINKLFITGSPLAMKTFGWISRQHVRKFKDHLSAKEMIYAYSPKDIVCNGPLHSDLLEYYQALTKSLSQIKQNVGHSSKAYADLIGAYINGVQ